MEFSFKDVFRIIKKNLVFILVIAFATAFATFFVTKVFIPKTYTSTVKLYINSNRSGQSSYDDLTSINYAQKLVATYIELLNTERFRSAVADELGNTYTNNQLRSMISIQEVESTEVFKATVTCTDPYEAKRIADAVALAAPETINEILSSSDNSNADEKASADSSKRSSTKDAELKVVDEAQLPTSPNSPNALRNAIIAFFGALLIALVISVLREYFDVKIKYNEEMTMLCGIPVLAAIPEFKYDKPSKSAKNANTEGAKS